MEKFKNFDSTIMPLNIENIDTDQIIPARFLKATTRDGFGDNLFRDWRYDSNNKLIGEFELNKIQTLTKQLDDLLVFHLFQIKYDNLFRYLVNQIESQLFSSQKIDISRASSNS